MQEQSTEHSELVKQYWRERKQLEQLRASAKEVPLRIPNGWVLGMQKLAAALLIKSNAITDADIINALRYRKRPKATQDPEETSLQSYWREAKRQKRMGMAPKEVALFLPPEWVMGMIRLSALLLNRGIDVTDSEVIGALRNE